MFSALPQILCSREDGPTGEDDVGKFRTRSPALLAIMGEFASVETCTAKRYHSILSQFAQALLDGRERLQREEQAQKPEGQEPSVAEPASPEPDLLDELQATSTEYFAGSFRSRAGSTEPAIRESVAAHSLVSVASNGQLDPHGQLISPHLESGGFSELGVTPVGSNLQYHSGIMDKDSEVINGMSGLMDFSSFFGWLEDGVAETQAIPWEFSWDGPPSNYFLSSRTSPGT